MAPLTRGSTTTLWPDKVAKVRATDSISALLKFNVMGSLLRPDLTAALGVAWVGAAAGDVEGAGGAAVAVCPQACSAAKLKPSTQPSLTKSREPARIRVIDVLKEVVRKNMNFNPVKANCAPLGAVR